MGQCIMEVLFVGRELIVLIGLSRMGIWVLVEEKASEKENKSV